MSASNSPSTGATLESAPLAWWPLLGVVGGSLLVCVYAFLISYFCSKEDQGLVVDEIADDDFVDPPPFEAPVKAPKEDLETKTPKPLRDEEMGSVVEKEKKVSIIAPEEDTVDGSVVKPPSPPPPALSAASEAKPAFSAMEQEPCIQEDGVLVRVETPPDPPLLGELVVEETEVEVPVDPNNPWALRPGPPAHVGQPMYTQPPSSRYGNVDQHPIYGGPGILSGRPGAARPVVDYSEELDALYGVVNTGRPVLSGRTYRTPYQQQQSPQSQGMTGVNHSPLAMNNVDSPATMNTDPSMGGWNSPNVSPYSSPNPNYPTQGSRSRGIR